MITAVFYLLSLSAFLTAVLLAAAGMQPDGRKADCWLAVVLTVCAFGLAAMAGRM